MDSRRRGLPDSPSVPAISYGRRRDATLRLAHRSLRSVDSSQGPRALRQWIARLAATVGNIGSIFKRKHPERGR